MTLEVADRIKQAILIVGNEAELDDNLDELQLRYALQPIDDNQRLCGVQWNGACVIAHEALIQLLLNPESTSVFETKGLERVSQ